MRRLLRALLVALAAVIASACDPCSGTVGCEVESRVSYTGKVIDFASGRGAPGVVVRFRPTGGGPVAADSLVVVTDAEGRYTLRVGAPAGAPVTGELTVAPPAPLEPYTVRDVRLVPTDVRGGGGVLPTYVTQPYVDYVAELIYRRSGGPLAYSTVTFTRTGGARLARGDRAVTQAGVDGWFYLEAPVVGADTVVGDLSVKYYEFARPLEIRGVRLPVRYTDRLPELDRSFRIGNALDYTVEIRSRATRQPVVGATVEFRRSGGLALQQPTYVGRTDLNGQLVLALTPLSEAPGEVVGDITVRPAGPEAPFVIRGVRIRSYDGDELPFLGVLGIGYQVLAAGELVFRGDRTPLSDVEVEFERTGGLATREPRVATRSLADGRFGFALETDSVGQVVGDLLVRVPGDAQPTRIPGVRLRAADDDSVRFMGRFGLGAQLLYVGQLQQRATGAPAAGWRVTFRRTGGIALVRDTVSAVTVDWGGFELAPPTRAVGEVEGELTAVGPDGGAPVRLGPVRLRTAADDSVRFAGRWNVGPSLLYVGELLTDAGTPVVGARIEFRRTGGIATAEAVVGERSNAAGRFRLAPTPLASGAVVGDLHVFPPAPLRDTVIANVRLETFDGDEVRLRDVWRLPLPR
ncbi:hypothetical protein [Roseisolibacter sp. H3M3-2]|uniref:hypothetical protein n=1 Tax=Roseisolibacter sp. H3M3-2 TaxID=3031323 RepID=UPI0023DC2977|nr:hypothetical protein [Roseisolibacter sp. H3M3-2]MDF1505314.1 hypothetical protein [Roseisolibacter sp. H3M3-2]